MSTDYLHPERLAPHTGRVDSLRIRSARRLVAEVVGTFLLTLSATAPDVLAAATGTPVPDAVKAFLPAMAVAVTIYALGDVSGAHLNPAVTVAFCLRRVFPVQRLPGYIGAQLTGGLIAVLMLRARYGPEADLGANRPHTDLPTALVCEVLLTFVLVTVILNVATKESLIGPQAAIPVGMTIAIAGLLGGHLSGASMNPARSLAPALAVPVLDDIWLYVLGPLAGAVLACAMTWLLHGRYEDDEKRAAQGSR